MAYLQNHHKSDIRAEVVSLYLSHGATGRTSTHWDRFYSVIYDADARVAAGHFWSIFGDGISGRHAEFYLHLWPYMSSESQNELLRFCAPATGTGTYAGTLTSTGKIAIPMLELLDGEQTAKMEIKNRIAELIASDNPELTPPSAKDVFLYAKGMCAISAVARALIPEDKGASGAVVFG
jgi:cystathionine gamma-synthase